MIDSRDCESWEDPRSAICKLESQESWWHKKFYPSSKSQEPGAPVFEGSRRGMNVSAQTASKFTLPLPFPSIQDIRGLNDAHLHWQGGSLFNLPMQMLIYSRDIITDSHGNNVLPAIWRLHGPISLICKINHHRKRLKK